MRNASDKPSPGNIDSDPTLDAPIVLSGEFWPGHDEEDEE